MATWRVVLKPEYVDALDSIGTELHNLAVAAPSCGAMDKIEGSRLAFQEFMVASLDLADGKTSPAGCLREFGHTPENVPIYVLTIGAWQGAFLIDFEAGICEGIEVVRPSFTSKVRAWFGKALP